MAWETRNGRGTYYTRSRRVGGRVVRKYIGSGETAVLIAELDRQERKKRQAEAAQWRERKAQDAALEAQLDEVCRLADLLAETVLLAAGYHRHHHGQWRKRRGKAKED
jgi:hypothetical protein